MYGSGELGRDGRTILGSFNVLLYVREAVWSLEYGEALACVCCGKIGVVVQVG